MSQTQRVKSVCHVTIRCDAPDEIIATAEYENVPAKYKEIIKSQKGLPCDGAGVPGLWCRTRHNCYFMRAEETWVEEDTAST